LSRAAWAPVSCTLNVKHNGYLAGYCEVVEVSQVEDALGYPCGRDTVGECTDCGTRVCNEHVEKCPHCDELFCITCLSFHESTVAAKKPAHDTQGEVKRRTA
jgi:hypothetical protein